MVASKLFRDVFGISIVTLRPLFHIQKRIQDPEVALARRFVQATPLQTITRNEDCVSSQTALFALRVKSSLVDKGVTRSVMSKFDIYYHLQSADLYAMDNIYSRYVNVSWKITCMTSENGEWVAEGSVCGKWVMQGSACGMWVMEGSAGGEWVV